MMSVWTGRQTVWDMSKTIPWRNYAAYTALRQAQQEQEEARELLAGETDPDMKELCQEQFQSAKETEAKLLEKLKILLLPKDPNDEKNVPEGNRPGEAPVRR